LGVLGWHSLLQNEMTPFDSLRATLLNKAIFQQIRERADQATKDLAAEYGEVEWTKGTGRRNTHCLAVAPTVTNSILSADLHGDPVSSGIEPWAGNSFTQKSAKGSFVRYNPIFTRLLRERGKNLPEVWQGIIEHDGSVQHLDFISKEEKDVFLTAREISQLAIIKQAGDRQKFLDQGQSVNLFFSKEVDARYFNQVHLEAWKAGMYGLYYCRSESPIRGDIATRKNNSMEALESQECTACEG
jgi:ribonucleoside-diphosphate reductase alpha chain